MGPLARFLLALTNLVRSGGIKKIPDAIKFAEQQFGKVTPLLKKQIEKVFEQAKKQIPGKPGEKGRVIPFKKTEGIETLDEFNLSKDDPMGDLEKIVKGEGDTGLPKKPSDTDLTRLGIENLKNPRRSGGPLDPVVGITRTIARRILDKKGIKIDRREDPLDIFMNNFGIGAGTDIQNLGEEIAEAETSGRKLKPLDDLIEIEGFFDLEVQKNPDKGMSDQEVLDMLEKDLKEKETLEDFDPTDRDPNAEGGLTRTSYAMGGGRDTGTIGEMKSKLGVLSNKVRRTSKRLEERGEPAFLEMGKGPVLPEDPTKPVNPFGPKPTGPVLPDKSMMAEFSLKDYMDEFERVFPEMKNKRGTQEYMDMLEDYFRGLASKDRTSSRVQAASGGLAEILKV